MIISYDCIFMMKFRTQFRIVHSTYNIYQSRDVLSLKTTFIPHIAHVEPPGDEFGFLYR